MCLGKYITIYVVMYYIYVCMYLIPMQVQAMLYYILKHFLLVVLRANCSLVHYSYEHFLNICLRMCGILNN